MGLDFRHQASCVCRSGGRVDRAAGATAPRSAQSDTVVLPTIDVSPAGSATARPSSAPRRRVMTAEEIEQIAGAEPAGHPVVSSRASRCSTSRRRHRRPRHGRHARLRRQRDLEYAGAGQRPAPQRYRPAGLRFCGDPANGIQRIEIIRGDSGAVLYGDGAVGGVINIVTKNGVRGCRRRCGSKPGSARSATVRQRDRRAAAGPWSAAFDAIGIRSDGYRENGQLRQQGARGDIRYSTDDGSLYLNVIGRRPASRPAGRPNGRLDAGEQPAHHRPDRRRHAQRLSPTSRA